MKITKAYEILDGIAEDQKGALDVAHWRYMCFIGITSIDDDSDRQAEEDRSTFAHLLMPERDGMPCYDFDKATDFMAAVTGLPRDRCLAWCKQDFYEDSDISFEEAVKLGSV